MQIPGGLDDRGAGIPYAAPGRTSQPGGQPGTSRDLRDLLGEGPAKAAGLAAPPAALVPAELQSALAVREIARPGHRRALHLGGEHPAGRASPGCLVGRDQVNSAPSVGQPLNPRDGHPVEVEQQRRIVDQARGSCMIVLRREQR